MKKCEFDLLFTSTSFDSIICYRLKHFELKVSFQIALLINLIVHHLCLSATPMSDYLGWNLNGTVLVMVERLCSLPLANMSQPLLPNNSQTVRMIRPSNYTENMENVFDVSRRCMRRLSNLHLAW